MESLERNGGVTPPKLTPGRYSLQDFVKLTEPKHVGPKNPTNTELCLPRRSSDHVPLHTVDRIVQKLCYDKFSSLCYEENGAITRAIIRFNEFVNDLYYTNFRKYRAIIRCSTEDWDVFIETMVSKYVAITMVQIGFLFDTNGNLVTSIFEGVTLDEYCFSKPQVPSQPVVIHDPYWISDFSDDDYSLLSWSFPDYDSDDRTDDEHIDIQKFVETNRLSSSQQMKHLLTVAREDTFDMESSGSNDDPFCCDYADDPEYSKMPELELWTHFNEDGEVVAPS